MQLALFNARAALLEKKENVLKVTQHAAQGQHVPRDKGRVVEEEAV